MRKIILILTFMLAILSYGVLAAQEDVEEPAYISYLVGKVDVDITPLNNKEDFVPAELDMDLPAGTIIRTGKNALCEISMPDESTIKISSGSVFQIQSALINKETGKVTEKFNLVAGKVRSKVQKFTTTDSEFTITSGTALAGVRGTNFGQFFDGLKTQILSFEDSIFLESLTGAFEPVVITPGKMTSVALDGLPEPIIDIPPDVLDEWEAEAQKFVEKVEEAVVEEAAPPKKPEEKAAEKPKKESFIEKFLRMNAYVGTVTIGDLVYSRWVFTPEVTLGKLGLGLYLPAIFSPDVGILGFKDWENHDEWNFTDLRDGLHDFIIKFYYVSWGMREDPLYFKIGNIDNFYLGHGFIVENYSNMIYFPEELTVGMQLNVDANLFGFETMLADFSTLELFGGRAYLRPMGKKFPLAFGATAVHDKPEPITLNESELPRILVFGADAELPVINLKKFKLLLYADAAKLGYLYTDSVPTAPYDLTGIVEPGVFKFVKGMGTAAGLMGNIAAVFNYRAEYRYILDYYEPGFINPLWENRRLSYPSELDYLIYTQEDPSYENTTSAGILIRGGMMLFKKLEFSLGYENYTVMKPSGEEKVQKGDMYVNVSEGLIPKVYGSLSYDRNGNLENLFKEPFDENTVLNANIFYEMAKGIALSVNYKRTFKYNDATGEFDPIDSFGINTNFSFF